MTTTDLVKKIHGLEKEVKELFAQNKTVLDAHQIVNNQLAQYLRDEEDRIRNLKEEFMLQVHTLRLESAKLTNEYRQELSSLRTDWAKTFLFNS